MSEQLGKKGAKMKTVKMDELLAGNHIENAAKAAIELANKENCIAQFDFNGVTVSATAKDTVGDVCAQFQRLMDESHAKYLASDEYKERCKREAEEERLRPIRFREQVLNLATMTEAQLRDFECPWPKTIKEVNLVLTYLINAWDCRSYPSCIADY